MKASYLFASFLLILFATGVSPRTHASDEPSAVPSRQATKQASASSSAESQQALVKHGEYLVTEVARCQYCHTPRDDNGNFIRARWLQGAPVWITPPRGAKEQWASHAPNIAGLPLTNEQALDVLERGVGTNGLPILPPMHRFHLHHEDALAVIAYLRSLPRGNR